MRRCATERVHHNGERKGQAIEEPPATASWKDKQFYKRECLELEKRQAFNKQLAERKETWWRDRLNEYFDLITSTMKRTQPGLREVLREKYHLGDGYYDGVAAMDYVQAWIKNALTMNPQHDYYEHANNLVLNKRLVVGCSDREFQAVARKWAFDINPFLRAPYNSDALGEFIIMKIMPVMADTTDRLLDELRKEGLLHDYESVIDRCSTIVQRRAKGPSATAAPVVQELESYLASCLLTKTRRWPQRAPRLTVWCTRWVTSCTARSMWALTTPAHTICATARPSVRTRNTWSAVSIRCVSYTTREL